MLLKEIMDHITYGEISDVFLSKRGEDGELLPENLKRLLSHINAGLYALHARFNIRTSNLKVHIREGMKVFPIYQKNCLSSGRPGAFIEELDVPVSSEVIKIIAVRNSKKEELPINEYGNPNSVRVTNNALIMPEGYADDHFYVYAKVGPKIISEDVIDFGVEYVEVELPYHFLEALGYYVASRILNPVGMADPMQQGTNYSIKYEQACINLQNMGADNGDIFVQPSVQDKGWV